MLLQSTFLRLDNLVLLWQQQESKENKKKIDNQNQCKDESGVVHCEFVSN